MNVAENIIRVLNALESAKLAAKVFLGTILWATLSWFLRDQIFLIGNEIGIGPPPVYVALAIAVYTLSVLLVEGGLRLAHVVKKKRSEHTRARKAESDAMVDKQTKATALKHFLNHAPKECIRPLRELMKSGTMEYRRSGELRHLDNIGAVEEVIETQYNHAVFRLSAESELIIRAHFEAERELHVCKQVNCLSENELDFLKLFTVSQSQYENPEQKDLLPHQTYLGGQSLERKEFVTRDNVDIEDKTSRERWSISSDAKAAIETEYALKFKREMLELGLDRVQASMASGSGLRGSRH